MLFWFFFGGLVGTLFGVPALVHGVVRRPVVASFASAAVVCGIFLAVLWHLDGGATFTQGVLACVATFPASLVIALGVGLVFERFRHPRPAPRAAPPLAWVEPAIGIAVLVGILIHAFIQAGR